MSMKSLEAVVKPDKHNLDMELVHQSQYMFEATRGLADANRELGMLELEIKNTLAATDDRVRSSWTENDGKQTEVAITRLIASDKKLQDLKADLVEAQYEVAKWAGLVETFRTRAYNLRELGELYRSEYFVRETIRGDTDNSSSNRADEVRSKAGAARRERATRER